MPAFVEHSFPRGFLLDEEKLRKLRDLIEKRLSTTPPPQQLTYKVYRGDSYSYTTASLDDVAKEDNEDWRRITRLELLVDCGKDLMFSLSFSDKGCALRIIGADRDKVFLLFSDVRDYLHNEVAVVRGVQRSLVKLASLGVILAFMMALLFTTFSKMGSSHLDEPRVKQILANPDVASKLNFLITDKMGGDPSGKGFIWWMVGLFAVTFLFTSDSLAFVARHISPQNEFLFGKRLASFTKRQRLVSNVIWVVVVGMLVSILAGLIVWRFTTPH